MKCEGMFINDRTCELCEELNSQVYRDCKKKYNKKIQMIERLDEIKRNCIHCYGSYENDWQYIFKCAKQNQCYCNPTLECEQHNIRDK